MGKNKHFGAGAKMALMALKSDARIRSKQKGKPQGAEIQILRIDDESAPGGCRYGIAPWEPKVYHRPAELGAWSTEVMVYYNDLDEKDVLFALNERYVKPKADVRVHFSKDGARDQTVARGYFECMQSASENGLHIHELDLCTLTWGVRGMAKGCSDIIKNEWEGFPVGFAFLGEVFETKVGNRALNWLDGAGIYAGGAQLFVLIELKGKHLSWRTNRQDVAGKDLDAVQDEIRRRLEDGELPELATFIEVFAASHLTSTAAFQQKIEYGLEHMNAILGITPVPRGKLPLESDTAETEDVEKSEGSDGEKEQDKDKKKEGEEGESEDTLRGKKRTRRGGGGVRSKTGVPTPEVCDGKTTGDEPLLYSSSWHRLYVNVEHELFAKHLKLVRGPKQDDLKAILCIELVAAFARSVAINGIPDGKDLRTIAASPTSFIIAANNGVKARISDLLAGKTQPPKRKPVKK